MPSIGLGAGGVEGAEAGAIAGAVAAAEEYEYGIGEEELAGIADAIPEGGGALLLAIEHTWAIPLRDAAAASGGIVLANDFINPMALIALGVIGERVAPLFVSPASAGETRCGGSRNAEGASCALRAERGCETASLSVLPGESATR